LETHGAQSPSIYAGRDVVVAYGYTSAQVAELIAAATEGATRRIEELSARLSMTENAARAMLRDLGGSDVPVERLPQALIDAARRQGELLVQLRRPDAPDSEVARLKERARRAVEGGELDTADDLLRQAENEELAAARRMREAVAVTRSQRAQLAEMRFRYVEAATLYQEAADLVPEDEPRSRANYLSLAGLALWHAGHYDDALALHDRALEIRRTIPQGQGLEVLSHLNRARILREQGKVAQALQSLDRALRMAFVYSTERTMVAILNNRAAVLRDMRDFASAKSDAAAAVSLAERRLGPEHPETAGPLLTYASVLSALGDHNKAEMLARRALAIRERTNPSDHPVVAATLVTLASIRRAQGFAGDAASLLARAAKINAARSGGDGR